MSNESQCNETVLCDIKPSSLTSPRSAGGSGDYTSLVPQFITNNKKDQIDGITINQCKSTRVPVPSCRKFTIKSPNKSISKTINQCLIDSIQQIQNTIQDRSGSNNQIQKLVRKSTIPVASFKILSTVKRSKSIDEIIMRKNKMNERKGLNNNRNGNKTKRDLRREDENDKINKVKTTETEMNLYSNRNSGTCVDASSNAHIIKQASRRVAFTLILNAWRQNRVHLASMIQQSTQLESQIEQQKLQIAVLRGLISADNVRIAAANEETKQIQETLTKAEETIAQIKQEKKTLKKTVSTLEERIIECNTEIKNAHNDNLMVRSQINALENQLSKDREKLLRVREDKKHLAEKLKQMDEKLKQRDIDVETLRAVHNQLEERFDEQRMINNAFMDEIDAYNNTIKELQDRNAELEKQFQKEHKIVEKGRNELCLVRNQLRIAKEDLSMLQDSNAQLETSLQETKSELQKQTERPWWSLAAELASGPIGALHSAARLALPALPPADELTSHSQISNRSSNILNMDELVLQVHHPLNVSSPTKIESVQNMKKINKQKKRE